MHLSKRKIVTALAVFFLIVVPACVASSVFLLRTIERKTQEVQIQNVRVQYQTDRLSHLAVLRAQYQKVISAQDLLRVLVQEQRVVTLIERIESIAAETHNEITINVVDRGKSKHISETKGEETGMQDNRIALVPGDDHSITLSLILTGTYNDFLKFINHIENMEYYADVLTISMTRAEEEEVLDRGSAILSLPGRNEISLTSQPTKAPQKETSQALGQKKIVATLQVVFYYAGQDSAEQKN